MLGAIYGHRHLLFFFKLVEVNDLGFVFRGTQYQPSSVLDVAVWKPRISVLWGLPLGTPTAVVLLDDGKRISINGRAIERQGVKPKIAFLSSSSNAFEELIDFFKSGRHC